MNKCALFDVIEIRPTQPYEEYDPDMQEYVVVDSWNGEDDNVRVLGVNTSTGKQEKIVCHPHLVRRTKQLDINEALTHDNNLVRHTAASQVMWNNNESDWSQSQN